MNAIALFTSATGAIQYAVRADGAVFRRYRSQHPADAGRRAPWRRTGRTMDVAKATGSQVEYDGFVRLERVDAAGVRLP